MPKRRAVEWSLRERSGEPGEHWSSDITLTFTRRGIVVSGWYDGNVGLGPDTLIPWDEVDRIRRELGKGAVREAESAKAWLDP